MNKNISLEDIKQFIQNKLNLYPLKENEKYFKISISIPMEEDASLEGTFVVIANNNEQARKKCFDYTTEMKKYDDLHDDIKMDLVPSNNTDKMDCYHFEIILGPFDAKEYFDYYSKFWDGFIKSEYYLNTNLNSEQNHVSFISAWKWPIIFIPLIIWMLHFLSSISK